MERVIFSSRVNQGIASEVLAAFNAVPRRGAESGGILLGRRLEGELCVDDFEPVLCSHRFGPSYLLDDDDRAGLEESIEWFRGEGVELEVLGFYRSQTGPEFGIDEQDREWMTRYAAGERSVFLLLRPEKNQSIAARLFDWRGGEPAEVYAATFPFEGPVEMAPGSGEAPVERILAGAGLVSPATTDEIGPESGDVRAEAPAEVMPLHPKPLEVVPVDPEPVVPATLQDDVEQPMEAGPVASRDQSEAPWEFAPLEMAPIDPEPVAPKAAEDDVEQPTEAASMVPQDEAERRLELAPLDAVPVDAEPVLPELSEPDAPAATPLAPLPPGRRRMQEAAKEEVPAAMSMGPLPPSRPLVREAGLQEPRSTLLWAAVLLLLTVAGGVLGYRSGLRPVSAPRTAVAPPPSPSSPSIAPSEPSGGFADRTTQAPSHAAPASMEEGVRASLEQWIRAVRTGDSRMIAASYVPGHGAVAREERPAILRISDLRILPVSEERAVATFRKHWQTSRRPMHVGEEEDRLTFDKLGDSWKIASEERTRVFWRQQAR